MIQRCKYYLMKHAHYNHCVYLVLVATAAAVKFETVTAGPVLCRVAFFMALSYHTGIAYRYVMASHKLVTST